MSIKERIVYLQEKYERPFAMQRNSFRQLFLDDFPNHN